MTPAQTAQAVTLALGRAYPGRDFVLVLVDQNGEAELLASVMPPEAKQILTHMAENWRPEQATVGGVANDG